MHFGGAGGAERQGGGANGGAGGAHVVYQGQSRRRQRAAGGECAAQVAHSLGARQRALRRAAAHTGQVAGEAGQAELAGGYAGQQVGLVEAALAPSAAGNSSCR